MRCANEQRGQLIMAPSDCGGQALKRCFGAGVDNLSQNVDLINQLNVFPVPDGDTGINLYHTVQRAYREIERCDSDDVSVIAGRFAYGALMGARGNSGTILSQLLKGFADGLGEASTISAERLTVACKAAVAQSYAAVSAPTEGTILTVAREAAEDLQRSDRGSESLRKMLERLVSAAQASLANTPDLLPILREADVVDAGGMGLLCFLEGMQNGPSRTQVTSFQPTARKPAPAVHAESYGYDVQFLMIGADLDIDEARRELEQLGWSVIVASAGETIKVHIHAHNPAIPLDFAIKSGAALDDVVVENMELQYRQRQSEGLSLPVRGDTEPSGVSVVAVVEGEGLRAVYQDLCCSAIVPGGAGRNPAAEDFVAAINEAPSERVIILPNDRNIVLAAQQAADFVAGKQVSVIATETVLQGIGAMLAFGDALDAEADFDATATKMRAAAGDIRSVEITRASRSTAIGDLQINQNDFIALVDGTICAASPNLDDVAAEALAALQTSGAELATIYYGAGVSARETDQLIRRLTKSIGGLEFEAVYGGQPLYPFLISVE